MYDINTDIEGWKYAEKMYDKETKEEDGSQKLRRAANPRKDKLQSEEDKINDILINIIPMKEHGREDVKKAKEIKLKSWNKYEAYEEREYEDQTVLDSTWIVDEKEDGRSKARLCAKGCQEDIDPRSDSLTAATDSMKMFLTMTTNEGFEMESLDVISGLFTRISIGTTRNCSSI